MLTIPSGKRMSIKLDEPTWKAIDWLSSQHHQSWQEWCATIVGARSTNENITASLREAAMAGMLQETVFADRAEQYALMDKHPLMRNSGTLDDDQFNGAIRKAKVAGEADFGGFSVLFGFDEHGQDSIWIKNGLREGMHFAFVLPEMGVKN